MKKIIINFRMISPASIIFLSEIVLAIALIFIISNRDVFRSYDSNFYFTYFDLISSYSVFDLHQIIKYDSIYPFISINNYEIELGFGYLTKLVSMLNPLGSEYTYSLVASASFMFRFIVMRKMGVPAFVAFIINLYALSLLELNALRVGLASTFLLYSVHLYLKKNTLKSILILIFSLFIHAQIAIFASLFVALIIINRLLDFKGSSIGKYVNFVIAVSISFLINYVMPKLSSSFVKLSSYYDAYTESTGLGVTNLFAMIVSIYFLFSIKNNFGQAGYKGSISNDIDRVRPIIYSLCSVFIVFATYLILAKSFGVISQRSFQVAFIIFAAAISSKYFQFYISRRKAIIGIIFLSGILISNIYIRYPVSNVFSPPFPPFIDLRVE